jgi:hypothetical protein
MEQLRAVASIERGSREPEVGWSSASSDSKWWRALLLVGCARIVVSLAALPSLPPPTSPIRSVQVAVVLVLSLAAAVLIIGDRDGRARFLGAVYLLGANAFCQPLLSSLANEPWAAFARGPYVEAFIPFAFWLFAREFPRHERLTVFDRLSGRIALLCATVGALLMITSTLMAWRPAPLVGEQEWLSTWQRVPGIGFWNTVFVLLVPALVASVWNAFNARPEERQRAAWFVAAIAAGLLPNLAVGVARSVSPAFEAAMAHEPVRGVVVAVQLLGVVSLPFSTAYVVLVHQTLRVGVVIQRILHVLFTRAVIAGALSMALCVFVVDLVLRPDRAVAVVVHSPLFTVVSGVVAAALVLLAVRATVLSRVLNIDSSDRTATLARAAALMARSRTNREVLFEAVGQLKAGLGSSRVVVFKPDAEGMFHAEEGVAPSLAAQGAIATILADVPAVLVHQDSSTWALLPGSERAWVVRARVEAVVRLTSPTEDLSGLIALGPRASGVPYSRSDLSFASAIASTAGIVLARYRKDSAESSPDSDANGAIECAGCGAVSDEPACECSTDSRPSPIPVVLAGKFRTLRRLGSGGMGIVYLAQDINLARPVALKTLPRAQPAQIAALFEEARTMALVDHPNLAMIYGLEVWRTTPVLVVEYLAGGTLRARLTEGAWPIAAGCAMGILLADALARLHAAGILHRDVKPSNIGLTRNDAPKLLDFGIARLLSRLDEDEWGDSIRRGEASKTTAFAGTPLYLPPEALQGAAPDVHVDLWGLSVVLLESMSGAHPFGMRPAGRIGHRRQVTAACSSLPRPLAEFLEQALSPDVRQRPQSAADYGERLKAAACAAKVANP